MALGIIILVALGLGGCGFSPSGAPSTGDVDAAANVDTDAAVSTPIDGRTTPIDAAASAIDAAALVAPGGGCTCDAQCANDGGQAGVCIHGICMTRATGACPSGGSQQGCPSGSRCWNLSGSNVGPLCWPDCASHTCAGTCDEDGSCVPHQDNDCDAQCATACG